MGRFNIVIKIPSSYKEGSRCWVIELLIINLLFFNHPIIPPCLRQAVPTLIVPADRQVYCEEESAHLNSLLVNILRYLDNIF